LFVLMDQLQEVSNFPEADRRITSIDFELLTQLASVGPFMKFIDPKKSTTDIMAFIKYLIYYSGKEDLEGWLES